MAKLYVFGIGGTGSRVLRSFAYLLTAGVKLQGFNEVVPIIIDADNSAGDKTDTIDLLQKYVRIYNMMDHTSAAFEDGFLNTKVSDCCSNNFSLTIPGGTSQSFKDYMNFSTLDDDDKAFVQMLFSEKNLDGDMSVGFKGNPNVGSVVLNQFIESSDFGTFANSFAQGDAIFIISSIFGGTGASGFPLLLKNLRSGNSAIANSANIATAPIGAISVLPYFTLDPIDVNNTEGQIDSGTFIQKTRAALKYYEKNLSEINSLYYIADDQKANYSNHDGGANQKNDPHFVEFASALAIFHFAQHFAGQKTGNNEHNYYEYGLCEDQVQFNFNNLYEQSKSIVMKPMTRLLLMHNYIMQELPISWSKSWASAHEPKFTKSNLNDRGFFETLTSLLKGYKSWLDKMASNNRSFAPFNLSTSVENVFELVSGYKAEKHFNPFADKNFDLFNNLLDKNKNTKNNDTGVITSIPANWMDLFARTTNDLIDKEIHL